MFKINFQGSHHLAAHGSKFYLINHYLEELVLAAPFFPPPPPPDGAAITMVWTTGAVWTVEF